MAAKPTRYAIKELLATGEQPFDDLDDIALDAIGKRIGRGELVVPVIVSRDGILLDGHQRLKAMLRRKRTFIDGTDVRVDTKVTAKNALEAALMYNLNRRHLTIDQKAEIARRLQRERRWSQRKIAELFGVSQPAVSQWLNPKESATPKKPKRTKRVPEPWSIPDGAALHAVESVTARLAGGTLDWRALSDTDREYILVRLGDLQAVLDEVMSQV